MKIALLAALISASLSAQTSTIPHFKKVPVYKTVTVCPKNYTLYVQQQAGWRAAISMDGITTNTAEMIYEWRTWDGETPLFQSEIDTARCFKGSPPKESK